MQTLILLLGLAVSHGTTASTSAVAPATACELLSVAEVASFLRVPAVLIDSLNSGMNGYTKVDLCSWYVHAGESEGVIVKLRRAASSDAVLSVFTAAKVDEEMSPPAEPAPVPGVGEEALYLPYADGTGGTIVVREHESVVTISGSVSKETLASMARKVLPRL
jgi:hypothetical protein